MSACMAWSCAWTAACMDHCLHGRSCSHKESELFFLENMILRNNANFWFWSCVRTQPCILHMVIHVPCSYPQTQPCMHSHMQICIQACVRLPGWRCIWIKLFVVNHIFIHFLNSLHSLSQKFVAFFTKNISVFQPFNHVYYTPSRTLLSDYLSIGRVPENRPDKYIQMNKFFPQFLCHFWCFIKILPFAMQWSFQNPKKPDFGSHHYSLPDLEQLCHVLQNWCEQTCS